MFSTYYIYNNQKLLISSTNEESTSVKSVINDSKSKTASFWNHNQLTPKNKVTLNNISNIRPKKTQRKYTSSLPQYDSHHILTRIYEEHDYASGNYCFCTSKINLPPLTKSDAHHVLQLMYKTDENSSNDRTPLMMDHHLDLTPKMRPIIVEWLMQVCEVFKLLRETFYLAVDFFDRFMSNTKMISLYKLQLIGITCIFIAAKVEEIYAPKLATLLSIVDEMYSENDILQQELQILHYLNWKTTNRITVIGWLGVYLQLTVSHRIMLLPTLYKCSTNENHLSNDQSFPYNAFVRVTQLTDLCMLDINMANFTYAQIATSALYHIFGKKTALSVSDLEWTKIESCVKWMKPFHDELIKNPIYDSSEMLFDQDSYMRQTDVITMKMYNNATGRQQEM